MPLLPRTGRVLGPEAATRLGVLLPAVPAGSRRWTPDPELPGTAPSVGWRPAATASSDAAPGAAPDPSAAVPAPDTVVALVRSGRFDPSRQGVLALAAVGLLAAILGGYLLLRGRATEQPLAAPSVAGASSESRAELVVDVAGKVRRPGLVRLATGARVDDALRAAGGVLPGTKTGALNLARKVADGEQVLVGVEVPSAGASAGGLLDLNAATAAQLDELPGIGPVLADKIVSWRTEHGRFASIDQLREVGGIGESKYAALKNKVRV